jgi:purine-binding chemotaxis protein CheW
VHESLSQHSHQQNHSHDIVQDYLDALLREVSLSVLRADSEPLSAASEITAVETVVDTNAETVAASGVETAVRAQDVPLPCVEPKKEALPGALLPIEPEPEVVQHVSKPQVEHQAHKAPRTTVIERSIPDWGQKSFAALLFDVGGIKMAAPLHALGGICLIEDNMQTVATQASWFMGLLRWNDRNLRVVDTAMFVMPERVKDDSHRAAYQSVIILGDSHWALAVDQADESVLLQADEIRWKHLLGTRPWLAGTLLNRLCALVDVDSLLTLLAEADTGSTLPTRNP